MGCKGNSTNFHSRAFQLLAFIGIVRLADSQDLHPFIKNAQKNYQLNETVHNFDSIGPPPVLHYEPPGSGFLMPSQVKLGFKPLQDELNLENPPKLKKSGSGDIDLIEDIDFRFNKGNLLKESSRESVVKTNHKIEVRPEKGQINSKNSGVSRSKPTSILTPKGRFRHYRVRPTSGSALQELKVNGNKQPRTYRRYRVRKNIRRDIEREEHDQAEKRKYPRVRYQNQYVRPKDSVVQKGILIKKSQPLINYTLPTLEPDYNSTENYGQDDEVNHQGERDLETSPSSYHSVNISGKSSTGSGIRVTKDVRKDGVTSFTPILNIKNNVPSKAIKTSIAPSTAHITSTNRRKITPSIGLTASLGNAASRISALTKSTKLTASLTKSTSRVAASPPVYVPTVPKTPVKSAIPQIPVTLPITTSPLSHRVPKLSVNFPVTASPLSPPVPQLNKGIKIPVAPSVKHALGYERRIVSSIKNNPVTKAPLFTQLNPYTTLFLPQYGGNSYGQLGPIHIPHQIPILNLPFPSAGGYGF